MTSVGLLMALAVLAVATPACPPNGSSPPGDDGGTGADPIEDFVVRFSRAVCAHDVACGRLAPTEQEACSAERARSQRASRVGAYHGATAFDPGLVESCLASFATLSCGVPEPTCLGVFTPQARVGERCYDHLDCKSARGMALCVGQGCDRTCQPMGSEFYRCNTSDECNAGLWCDPASMSCRKRWPTGTSCGVSPEACAGYCDLDGGSCRDLPRAGEPCAGYRCARNSYCDPASNPRVCRAFAAVGESCATSPCVDEAYCEMQPPDPPSCIARKSADAGCRMGLECQEGLSCIDSVCSSPRAEGQPCRSIPDCQAPLVCDDVLRTCQYASPVPTGATCTGSTVFCVDRERCLGATVDPSGGPGTTGTCALPKPGDPCSLNFHCDPGGYCQFDGGAGTCAAGGLGTPCESPLNCPAGFFCDWYSRLCSPKHGVGEPCFSANDDCVAPYACVRQPGGGVGGDTCQARVGPGEPCPSPDRCLPPYVCEQGACASAGHLGEKCSHGPQCVTGVPTIDGGLPILDGGVPILTCTCMPYRAEGQTCVNPSDCESLTCIGGICVAACL